MATKIENDRDYELGDRVSFKHEGSTLVGEVVRVYNTRDWYHVEAGGERYSVSKDELRPFNRDEDRERLLDALQPSASG